jgi:hypothetical protein
LPPGAAWLAGCDCNGGAWIFPNTLIYSEIPAQRPVGTILALDSVSNGTNASKNENLGDPDL